MTKTEQNRILAWRLKVLREASAAPRNVAQACRHFGLSRKSFYKWKARYEAHGDAGLCDQPRAPRHIQQRLAARLSERERIARDLHDTLLQSVQGLMLEFRAGANAILAGSAARNKLENALAQGRDVIEEGRARVLDLRRADAPSKELATQLSSYGASFLQSSGATFNASVVGQAVPLNPVAADDVLNIGREAIVNAFMHAEARRIEIELTYDEKSLSLLIRDDGKGMERGTVEAGQAGHWGIVGMRERTRALGAKLNIWSRPGSGTEIELIVPAATAFAANGKVTKRSLVERIRDVFGIKRSDGDGSEH